MKKYLKWERFGQHVLVEVLQEIDAFVLVKEPTSIVSRWVSKQYTRELTNTEKESLCHILMEN